jgi:hypothetical protein
MGNNNAIGTLRKGDLVRLDENSSEIKRAKKPFGSNHYIASRPSTSEERSLWRKNLQNAIEKAKIDGKDTFSIACDSAGESRLPPRTVSVRLNIDGIYIVERARCRVELGWGRATGGLARILDTESGDHAYVKRHMLKKI